MESQLVDTIVGGSVAGLIAGLVIAVLLALASEARQLVKRRQEEKYVRDLFIEGKVILTTEDLPLRGGDYTIPADDLRAAQYKMLLKQVGVGLERWTPHLSLSQRKDIYDALDWFHTDPERMLVLGTDEGGLRLLDVPEGTWPGTSMNEAAARSIYERLCLVRWLRLKV